MDIDYEENLKEKMERGGKEMRKEVKRIDEIERRMELE